MVDGSFALVYECMMKFGVCEYVVTLPLSLGFVVLCMILHV